MKLKLFNKNHERLFLFLIFITGGICLTAISCSNVNSLKQPVTINQTDTITLNVPEYDKTILPLLLSYKIIVTNEDTSETFFESPDSKTFTITLPKEKLSSILIYPITKPEFFLPAGCIYPDDFYELKKQKTASTIWSSGPACILLSEMLSSNNENEIKLAKTFNWKKLEETLYKKDLDSFENFDFLKTKKCTTAYNLKKDILKEKILYPDSKISVSYFDTKSILASNIKDEEITPETRIYSEYIPLNDFYKEKGWITFQNDSESKTAFLIDGKITYISK